MVKLSFKFCGIIAFIIIIGLTTTACSSGSDSREYSALTITGLSNYNSQFLVAVGRNFSKYGFEQLEGAASRRSIAPPATGFAALPVPISISGASFAPLSSATPTVNQATPQAAVNHILGPGITASNITWRGDPRQLGIFSAPDGWLPMTNGIVISTGNVANIFTTGNGDPGDLTDLGGTHADLNYILWHTPYGVRNTFTRTTQDFAILEFDVIPDGGQLSLSFFFMSVEFDQGINFNDIFALWAFDPAIGLEETTVIPQSGEVGLFHYNIARLPPEAGQQFMQTVTISSARGGGPERFGNNTNLNHTMPFATKVLNRNHQGHTVRANGFTDLFFADASHLERSDGTKLVRPGVPVRFRLAIADVGDRSYDSNIFIQADSVRFGIPLGTKDNPIIITTEEQLRGIGSNSGAFAGWTMSAHYVLANNITLTSPWTPIGSPGTPFNGTLNGAGHTVGNVNITGGDNTGFFGQVGISGIIENFGIASGNINGANNTGALAGVLQGEIRNSFNNATVNGNNNVGGLVGLNNGNVENVYNTGAVDGNDFVGGIAGQNGAGRTISKAYNTGAVDGRDNVGGIAGQNNGVIDIAYNTGAVDGRNNVGGLAGQNAAGRTVSNSFNTGNISGASYVGGLAGLNAGAVELGFNTGDIFATADYTGGITGGNTVSGTVTSTASLGLMVTGGDVSTIGRISGTQTAGLTTNAARIDMEIGLAGLEEAVDPNNAGPNLMDGDDWTPGSGGTADTVFNGWIANGWTVPGGNLNPGGFLPTPTGVTIPLTLRPYLPGASPNIGNGNGGGGGGGASRLPSDTFSTGTNAMTITASRIVDDRVTVRVWHPINNETSLIPYTGSNQGVIFDIMIFPTESEMQKGFAKLQNPRGFVVVNFNNGVATGHLRN